MTIQSAVYNKGSLILCSDLRQTVEEYKSYIGVKKIFEMNETHPIGIMINGLMDFQNIPLETLIGEFRKNITDFSDIRKIQEEFINFLHKNTSMTSAEEYLYPVLESFKIRMMDSIDEVGFENTIDSRKLQKIPDFIKNYSSFDSEFYEIIPEEYDKRNYNLKIWEIFSYELNFEGTEIILAGFNENHHYGSLFVFNIYYNSQDGLIWKEVETIINCPDAFIRVYAMNEEAYTFITGVSSDFEDHITSYVNDTHEEILHNMEWYLKERNIENHQEIVKTLKEELSDKFNDLIQSIDIYKLDSIEYTSSCCEYLPRQLLCDFADSLIKLTALKQKISLDLETVSSESDIALITKTDNLKWIKYTDEIV